MGPVFSGKTEGHNKINYDFNGDYGRQSKY